VRSGILGTYAFQKLHQKNYGSDDFEAPYTVLQSLLFLISQSSVGSRPSGRVAETLQPCPRANGRHLYLSTKTLPQ
jgi:hypothetical protein